MKEQKSSASVLLKSHKGNRYYFDRKKKKTILCHPILYFILGLNEKGVNLDEWFRDLPDKSIIIDGYGPFTQQEIEYYYKKYLLLKINGYFQDINQGEKLNAKLSAEDVKHLLANTGVVTFEVTDRCNLNCAYCSYGKFYDSSKMQKNKNMDPSIVMKTLEYMTNLWNSSLNFSHDRNIYIGFYGGEPLLNFSLIQEVIDFVKKLNTLHNKFTFSITTNGVLLNKYMKILVENEFNLLISIDGNEYNNSYRVFKNGKPAFHRILKNIASLQSKYPEYFKQKVNFNTVLHNRNSVSAVYNFFKKKFGKTPSISPLNTTGVREDQKEEFWRVYSNLNENLFNSEDYSAIEKDMFIKLPNIQSISTFLHKSNDFAFENYKELIHSSKQSAGFPTGTCLPFSRKLFVTVEGKLLPCERIDQQHELGQITPHSVKINFYKIACLYNSWFDNFRKQCTACYNVNHCIQCFFQLDTNTPNPICNGFMAQSEYLEYVSTHLGFLEKKPGMYSNILKNIVVE